MQDKPPSYQELLDRVEKLESRFTREGDVELDALDFSKISRKLEQIWTPDSNWFPSTPSSSSSPGKAQVWYSASGTGPGTGVINLVDSVQQVKLTAPIGATNWDNSFYFRVLPNSSHFIYVDILPDGRMIVYYYAQGVSTVLSQPANIPSWAGTTRWFRASVLGSVICATLWDKNPLDPTIASTNIVQTTRVDMSSTQVLRDASGDCYFSYTNGMTAADHYIWEG